MEEDQRPENPFRDLGEEKDIPGPTGRFPDGQLNPDDSGELNIAIGADYTRNVVAIMFGAPVSWIALPKSAALAFAEMILEKARSLK